MSKDDPKERPKEPQSYGSRKEWKEGKTGEDVPPPVAPDDRAEAKREGWDQESQYNRWSRRSEIVGEEIGTVSSPGNLDAYDRDPQFDDSSVAPVVGTARKNIPANLPQSRRDGYFKTRDYPDNERK
ncbi:MAG: hypothetical protein WBX15_06175 [Thermoanaerobaculia bacterium]